MLIQVHAGDLRALEQHLVRKIPPLIAICDAEPLVTQRALTLVRQHAQLAGFAEREMCTAEGRGFDWRGWQIETTSASLFSARKLVELRIPNGKPGTDGTAALQQVLTLANPDVLVIVLLPAADWQMKKAAWFMQLSQAALCVETQEPAREQLPAWINAELRRSRQSADQETLRWLAERFEGNLLAGEQELQKLALLLPEGQIQLNAVRAAVLDVARWDPADLSLAALQGDAVRTQRVAEGLAQEAAAPPLVLWSLSDDLRQALRARWALDQGRPRNQLGRELRLNPTRTPAILACAQRTSAPMLQALLAQAARVDTISKGLAPGDAWLALNQLALAIADPSRFQWMMQA